MRVLFLFYKNFAIPSSLITLLIVAFTFDASVSGLMLAIWAKMIMSGLVGLFFYIFQADHFYFFENMGYTRLKLFAGAFMIDVVGFAVALTLMQLWI